MGELIKQFLVVQLKTSQAFFIFCFFSYSKLKTPLVVATTFTVHFLIMLVTVTIEVLVPMS